MTAIHRRQSQIMVLVVFLVSLMVAGNIGCRKEGENSGMNMKMITLDKKVISDTDVEVVCYLAQVDLQKNSVSEAEMQRGLNRLIQLTDGFVDADEQEKRMAESHVLDNVGIKTLLKDGVFAEMYLVKDGKRVLASRYVIRFPHPRFENTGDDQIRVKRE